MAYVEFLSDLAYENISVEEIVTLNSQSPYRSYLFVVDNVALSHPEHPILVIDLFSQPGHTFRVIPTEMWSVENNLSIANMDFEDFTDSADPDGIFRGFSEP